MQLDQKQFSVTFGSGTLHSRHIRNLQHQKHKGDQRDFGETSENSSPPCSSDKLHIVQSLELQKVALFMGELLFSHLLCLHSLSFMILGDSSVN